MPSESPRIAELRRRVDADPSSIAFAQLAEEYRRAGNYPAAEQCCRTGLTRHPSYLSARVTLGRTLIELDKLEEAESELEFVLKSAPDNLSAIRGMAEIHQRRGNLELALDFYRRALPLARHDPEIEERVQKINRDLAVGKPKEQPGLSLKEAQEEFLNALNQLPALNTKAAAPVAAPAAAAPMPAAPVAHVEEDSVEEPSRAAAGALDIAPGGEAPAADATIDFDSLLKSLGVPDHQPPPAVEALLSEPAAPVARPEPVLSDLPLNTESDDRFAELEQGLRAFDQPIAAPPDVAAPPSEPLGYGEFSFDTAPAYTEAPAAPAVEYGERFVAEASAPVPPPPTPEPIQAAGPDPMAEPAEAGEEDILDELEAWLAAIKR